MTHAILVMAMLAVPLAGAKDSGRVSIFVGPMAREGFVDVDRGVLDSIKDVQDELRKNRAFAVVADETVASLKLYVMWRGMGENTATVTQGYGTAQGTAGGGSAQGSGYGTSTSVTVPTTYKLEALLRVGTHEKTLTGESGWTRKRCAKAIVKDLTTWVAANRERIP